MFIFHMPLNLSGFPLFLLSTVGRQCSKKQIGMDLAFATIHPLGSRTQSMCNLVWPKGSTQVKFPLGLCAPLQMSTSLGLQMSFFSILDDLSRPFCWPPLILSPSLMLQFKYPVFAQGSSFINLMVNTDLRCQILPVFGVGSLGT